MKYFRSEDSCCTYELNTAINQSILAGNFIFSTMKKLVLLILLSLNFVFAQTQKCKNEMQHWRVKGN